MAINAKPKVTIIGAGLAGLTTAYRLFQKGYDVNLYEARPRVGGRVHSVLLKNFEGGYSIGELGGQSITDGGEAKHLLTLAKELQISTQENEIAFTRLLYSEGSFHDPESLLLEAHFEQEIIEEKLKLIKKTAQSIQEILDYLFPKPSLLKRLFTLQLTAYEGSHPALLGVNTHNIETLEYMLLGGVSKVHQVTESKPTLNLMSLKGGNATLPLALAQKLKDRIHLNKALYAIHETEEKRLRIEFTDKTSIPCDQLILAIPCTVYNDIHFDKQVIDQTVLDKIKAVQYGITTKILVPIQYEQIQYNTIMMEKMVSFFNEDHKLLNLYFTEDPGTLLLKKQFQLALPILKEGYNQAHLLEDTPLTASEEQFGRYEKPILKSWIEDIYAKGSYSNYGVTSASFLEERVFYNGIQFNQLFSPIDNRIFFVGEHTTILDEIGTMEAAVESGERVARLF